MALQEKEKLIAFNLKTLQKRDAAIDAILDMSSHVVLYQFDEAKQSWERKNIEGALFVVRRSAATLERPQTTMDAHTGVFRSYR